MTSFCVSRFRNSRIRNLAFMSADEFHCTIKKATCFYDTKPSCDDLILTNKKNFSSSNILLLLMQHSGWREKLSNFPLRDLSFVCCGWNIYQSANVSKLVGSWSLWRKWHFYETMKHLPLALSFKLNEQDVSYFIFNSICYFQLF